MAGLLTWSFLVGVCCCALPSNARDTQGQEPVLASMPEKPVSARNTAFYINFCAPSNHVAKDFYILNAMAGPWPSDLWCQALSSAEATPGPYDLNIDLYNFIGNGKTDFGHPGVIFNAKDSLNFDFVYFRPHSSGTCFQTGHMVDGVRTFSTSSHCPRGPPRGRKWFNVKVLVWYSHSAYLLLDDYLVTVFQTHFTPLRGGGAMTAQGYKNLVFFKNYRIRPVTNRRTALRQAGCMPGSGPFLNFTYLVNAASNQPPRFCRMLLDQTLQPPVTSYQFSLRLFNVRTKRANIGHPGVMYNVQDLNNYDFVYFRPHSSRTCYQTGYMKNGAATFRTQGACPTGPPPSHGPFSVKVYVIDVNTVLVYMNHQLVVTVHPQFPVTPRVGLNVVNDYGNIVKADSVRLVKV